MGRVGLKCVIVGGYLIVSVEIVIACMIGNHKEGCVRRCSWVLGKFDSGFGQVVSNCPRVQSLGGWSKAMLSESGIVSRIAVAVPGAHAIGSRPRLPSDALA